MNSYYVADLVVKIVGDQRQYMNRSTDDKTFDWVLADVETLETAIILKFRELTAKYVDIVFSPPGWFVEQLEKEVIAAMEPLKNPFPTVKGMTPPRVYGFIRVKLANDRNKIFECRALYHTLLPTH